MLKNPFTPSEIASSPEDFYGRRDDLHTLERPIIQGSVAIQGPIGIGKSSLMSRGMLALEGFGTQFNATCVLAVADRDVKDVDQAAAIVLAPLVEFDESKKSLKFKIGSLVEHESSEMTRHFAEGRDLSNLKRIVEKKFLENLLKPDCYLIVAVDEADKCPVPLARMVRSIVTHTQQLGVKRVRFLLAGVAPFFQQMVDEDAGISRFFYKTISLQSLPHEESIELMESKLQKLSSDADQTGIPLEIKPGIVGMVASLAGGHPHLLQLLGSHLVEHEDADPDGVIDDRDLVTSLTRICYEDRARVYDSLFHELDVYGKRDAFEKILSLAKPGFPTRISRRGAERAVAPDIIQWLIARNILFVKSDSETGLVDEFIRVRLKLDEQNTGPERDSAERDLILYQGRNEEAIRRHSIASWNDDE